MDTLQTTGIRTAIADPVSHRRIDKLPAEQRRGLRRATRTTRSRSGRALMRRRGELSERSFVHVLDYGGARRTPLRGRENIFKRYRIQVAAANLALLLRHVGGIGTLKQSWAASKRALLALLRLVQFLGACLRSRCEESVTRLGPMTTAQLPTSVHEEGPHHHTSTVS